MPTTTHISLRVNTEVLKKVKADAEKQRRSRNFIIDEILALHYNQPPNGKPTKKAGSR
jgi:predicted transcriptional regulator